MPANVAAKASGTVMLAMKVGQKRRRNRKITITTSAMLSRSENWTSFTEAWMVRVRSLTAVIVMAGGSHSARCGSLILNPADHSITLASDCLKTITSTATLVPDHPACNVFSTPSMARPIDGEPERAGGLLGNDEVLVVPGVEELVIAVQGVGQAVAFEAAFGLIHVDLR